MKEFLLYIYDSLLNNVNESRDKIIMHQELYDKTDSLYCELMLLNYELNKLKLEIYKSLLPKNWIKE